MKKELKSRGLNTLGSKNELMERLQEALNGNSMIFYLLYISILLQTSGSCHHFSDDEGGDALDNDDILDEDAVLAVCTLHLMSPMQWYTY